MPDAPDWSSHGELDQAWLISIRNSIVEHSTDHVLYYQVTVIKPVCKTSLGKSVQTSFELQDLASKLQAMFDQIL